MQYLLNSVSMFQRLYPFFGGSNEPRTKHLRRSATTAPLTDLVTTPTHMRARAHTHTQTRIHGRTHNYDKSITLAYLRWAAE